MFFKQSLDKECIWKKLSFPFAQFLPENDILGNFKKKFPIETHYQFVLIRIYEVPECC